MAIVYQSSHPQYYKRLSDYQMSAECNLSSNGDLEITRLSAVMMFDAHCEDHNQGFALPKDVTVKTVKYPGFAVVALGVPHNLWLPDLTSFDLMRRDLRNNEHVLFCWECKSIAIITDKFTWVPVFEDFLSHLTTYRYIKGAGLYVSV